MDIFLISYYQITTVCSQTSGVWKEKKCVQVSRLESMSTGSGGDKLVLGGLGGERDKAKV